MSWEVLRHITILIVLVVGALFPLAWVLLFLLVQKSKQDDIDLNNIQKSKELDEAIEREYSSMFVGFRDNVLDEVQLAEFKSTKKTYMDGPKWNTKRKKRLKYDNYVCQKCGAMDVPLDVHHTKDYKKIPNEPISSLVSLCRPCHNKEHEHYGYPQILDDYLNWNAPIKD